MPLTIPDINERLGELQDQALTFVRDAQDPAVDYVSKAAQALADRLPEDRPELVGQVLDALVGQVDFAKKLLDTNTAFAKAVLDAVVAPVKPAPAKAKTVKAA